MTHSQSSDVASYHGMDPCPAVTMLSVGWQVEPGSWIG